MAASKTTDIDEFQFQLSAQQQFQKTQESSDGQTYTDPTDGTVYEWDSQKRAWFPKIDAAFLAAYHSNYGFYQPDDPDEQEGTTSETPNTGVETNDKKEEEPPQTKKKRLPSNPGWFEVDEDHNTNVYVSGLPLDIGQEEFHTLMSKCGIIMNDEDGCPKLKLYHDINGRLKGDGLCCYLKIESVQLALQLLDQSDYKGNTIRIEQAKFQMKGSYDPSLKKKKKPIKKKGKEQERQLDWRERKEGPKRTKYDKIVIFKHLFDPKEFEEDAMLINEIRDDLRDECQKFGEVKKVLLFDRHVDGVGSVAFKDVDAADQCVLKMNGRWYGGKQLEVFTWDGTTDYQIEETEKEREQRIKQWEQFLESSTSEETKETESQQTKTNESTETTQS